MSRNHKVKIHKMTFPLFALICPKAKNIHTIKGNNHNNIKSHSLPKKTKSTSKQHIIFPNKPSLINITTPKEKLSKSTVKEDIQINIKQHMSLDEKYQQILIEQNNLEEQIEIILSKISKIKKKQNSTLQIINKEYLHYLSEIADTTPSNITEPIIEFFGLKIGKLPVVAKNIRNEEVFKYYFDNIAAIHKSNTKLEQKIKSVKLLSGKYSEMSLYPFNLLYELIERNFLLEKTTKEYEKLLEKLDVVEKEKRQVLLEMKQENKYNNNNKEFNESNSILEKSFHFSTMHNYNNSSHSFSDAKVKKPELNKKIQFKSFTFNALEKVNYKSINRKILKEQNDNDNNILHSKKNSVTHKALSTNPSKSSIKTLNKNSQLIMSYKPLKLEINSKVKENEYSNINKNTIQLSRNLRSKEHKIRSNSNHNPSCNKIMNSIKKTYFGFTKTFSFDKALIPHNKQNTNYNKKSSITNNKQSQTINNNNNNDFSPLNKNKYTSEDTTKNYKGMKTIIHTLNKNKQLPTSQKRKCNSHSNMKYKMHYITNLSRNKQPPKSKLIVSKSPSSFTTKQHSKLTTNGQTSTINTPSVNTPYQISQGNSQRILVEELTGISQYLNTESAEIQQERLETNAQNYLKVLDELNNSNSLTICNVPSINFSINYVPQVKLSKDNQSNNDEPSNHSYGDNLSIERPISDINNGGYGCCISCT